MSIACSALTSHLNWATVQQYEPWGQAGRGRAAERMDSGGQMNNTNLFVTGTLEIAYFGTWKKFLYFMTRG